MWTHLSPAVVPPSSHSYVSRGDRTLSGAISLRYAFRNLFFVLPVCLVTVMYVTDSALLNDYACTLRTDIAVVLHVADDLYTKEIAIFYIMQHTDDIS